MLSQNDVATTASIFSRLSPKITGRDVSRALSPTCTLEKQLILKMDEERGFSSVPVVWEPKAKFGKEIRIFMDLIRDKYDVKMDCYWDLHQWSVRHIPEFWAEIWKYFGIICSKSYRKVIDMSIPMSESPEWFEGARLNYAENLLKYRDDGVALILAGEDTETAQVTYAQLHEETKLYAAAFRKLGISKGDIVMCYMSNRKEAVLAMMATVSVGAIWTGALPQLGCNAVLNRVSQLSPKLLFTVDRFSFNNEEIEMLEKVEGVASALPSLKKVVIVPSKEESKRKDISQIKNSCFLDEFLSSLGREVPEIVFEQVSLSHPIFISFTSGTTGPPKALVHGSGILLSVAKDYVLHMDAKRGDVILSMSPVGWGTWNWFATVLFCGYTVVLYEGCPFFQSPTAMWDMIDELHVSHVFTTSSAIEELEKRKYVPTSKHHLSSLKLVMSGGSVVKLKSYDFIYENLKLDVLFGSIYGTTEVLGICSTLDFTLPVHRGEIPTPTLGTLIECYDETTGKPVVGDIGDLVISTPSPSLVLKLYHDEDGSQFRKKYFNGDSGCFVMGDHGIINPVTRGLVICGRSDATLKQRGCRFGSSEIYNIVDLFPEVQDSVCVSHYNREKEERAVLFLQMKEGHRFDDDLVSRIRLRIAKELTPRHVPDVLLETQNIPRNANGKKVEIIVKKIINGLPCSEDGIVNPGSLRHYHKLQDF